MSERRSPAGGGTRTASRLRTRRPELEGGTGDVAETRGGKTAASDTVMSEKRSPAGGGPRAKRGQPQDKGGTASSVAVPPLSCGCPRFALGPPPAGDRFSLMTVSLAAVFPPLVSATSPVPPSNSGRLVRSREAVRVPPPAGDRRSLITRPHQMKQRHLAR